MSRERIFDSHNETQQLQFGAKLAQGLDNKASVIFLQGELGAGKTTLIRGLLQALGYKAKIKSPTYGLMEVYEFDDLTVLHLDLYRIKNPPELESLSLRDYLKNKIVLLVEWPEKGGKFLPTPDLSCLINTVEQGRLLKFIAHTQHGEEILARL